MDREQILQNISVCSAAASPRVFMGQMTLGDRTIRTRHEMARRMCAVG